MIYYLLALVSGLILGSLLKKREIKTDRIMLVVLILLIFFLGVDIGKTLNLYELSQVGILSLIFSIAAVVFSYLVSKVIRGV